MMPDLRRFRFRRIFENFFRAFFRQNEYLEITNNQLIYSLLRFDKKFQKNFPTIRFLLISKIRPEVFSRRYGQNLTPVPLSADRGTGVRLK